MSGCSYWPACCWACEMPANDRAKATASVRAAQLRRACVTRRPIVPPDGDFVILTPPSIATAQAPGFANVAQRETRVRHEVHDNRHWPCSPLDAAGDYGRTDSRISRCLSHHE